MASDRERSPKGSGDAPPPVDQLVTRRQIFEIMSYEGYSADQRKDWLKSALTYAAKRHEEAPSDETATTLRTIREMEDFSEDDIASGEGPPHEKDEDR